MGKHEATKLDSREKKRRKKDRTAALSIEDITPSSTDAPPTPTLGAQHDSDSYVQSQALNKIQEQAVEEFRTSQGVDIEDPASSTALRPILSFSHLPLEVASQFQNVFKTFEKPSSIQSATWPFLLSGRDLVGVAETGSGKTLAFGLPLVTQLQNLNKTKGIRAVVVAPTRELAIQVFDQIAILCKTSSIGLNPVCIYGGSSKDEQKLFLRKANIIVATPGRLKDFLSDGTVSLDKVRYLVLDEADRMLDKGFEDDIKLIISHMPTKKRQTAMFTATWPRSVRELASSFMNAPVRIAIGQHRTSDNYTTDPSTLRANPRIKQVIEVIEPLDKQSRLLQLLRAHHSGSKQKDRILIFCLYKKEATRIESFLARNGHDVAGIHGDLAQSARLASLSAFKSGKTSLLVATDVAARGLDIPAVKLVINVTFPLTAEDYVHRIGRTGRAGADGLAITFFTEQDKGLAGALVNVLKGAKQEVPEDLLKFGTTVKRKQHEMYGNFGPKEDLVDRKATRITFDD